MLSFSAGPHAILKLMPMCGFTLDSLLASPRTFYDGRHSWQRARALGCHIYLGADTGAKQYHEPGEIDPKQENRNAPHRPINDLVSIKV